MGATKKEKIEALTAWLATPEELRPVTNLRQLALSIGATPDGNFYALANSPEIAREVLGITAAIALPHVPNILERLAQSALKGNVHAAEIYLNYVHQVIRTMAQQAPKPDVEEAIEKAMRGAQKMLAAAQPRGCGGEELGRKRQEE